MPKVLIVVNVDWFLFSHRLPIAIAAKRNGYDVHIATTFTDSSHYNKLISLGFTVHRLSIDRSFSSPLSLVRLFLDLLSICLSERPNLVHLVTIQPLIVGGIVARILSIKAVVFAISGLGSVFSGHSLISSVRRFFVLFLTSYHLVFLINSSYFKFF